MFDLLPVHFALCIFESKLLMFSYSKCKSIIVVFSSEIRRVGSVFAMTRYVKRVQIRIFSGPYFAVFGPEKTPYLDTFHAVTSSESYQELRKLKEVLLSQIVYMSKCQTFR